MLEEKLCFIHLPKNGALSGKQENTRDDTRVTCSASFILLQNVFKTIKVLICLLYDKKSMVRSMTAYGHKFGVGKTFKCFFKKSLFSPKLHLLDKYSKNRDIFKYYCNLSILGDLKQCNLFMCWQS